MNKSLLKTFATKARVQLMQDVAYRLGLMGITKKGIAAPTHQTADMQAFEYAPGQSYRLFGADLAARGLLADLARRKGFDQLVEEVAYTWFNRLVAIRFMEVNDYLPTHTRALSSLTPGQSVPDMVSYALDVDLGLTEKEREQVIAWKLESKVDELFRFLFLKLCGQLEGLLLGLFGEGQQALNPALSLLLTISCVKPDGVVAELLRIPESYFNISAVDEEGQPTGQVEIIGWMYQFYNAELKLETNKQLTAKKTKICKERIPAVTQLFTPQWIVKYLVENSLGRLWVEKLLAEGDPRGEADIAKAFGWRYYLPEAAQTPEVQALLTAQRKAGSPKTPEDLRVMDPCMGSGHMLVYAFDLLMQLYSSRGYLAADAARHIVEKNLWGLDLDDRACQLAYFAVMMKARQFGVRKLNELRPNLHAVQSSRGLDTRHLDYFGNHLSSLERNTARNQAEELLALFREGKLLGSLIRVPDWDLALLQRYAEDFSLPLQVDMTRDLHHEEAQPRLLQLVRLAQALRQPYDVTVTNPPYLGSASVSADLASYLKEEFPDSKSDLFAVFIERCTQMTKPRGYTAMVTMHAWMFLSSYEKLRARLLKQREIINMAHLGARAFEEIGGEVVQTTAFVLGGQAVKGYQGSYARLVEPNSQDGKEEMFLAGENRFVAEQRNYEKIPGAPVVYWASRDVISLFSKYESLSQSAVTKQGLKSSDDKRFFRFWTEVMTDSIDFSIENHARAKFSTKTWVPLNKGGTTKWYGDNWHLVNWANNGHEIKEYAKSLYKNATRTITSIEYYFIPCISWPQITDSPTFRSIPKGFIFNAAGPSMFLRENDLLYCLGFLNTKIAPKITSMLNPTVNLNVSDLLKIPFIRNALHKRHIESLVSDCVQLSMKDQELFETSWDFDRHPLV